MNDSDRCPFGTTHNHDKICTSVGVKVGNVPPNYGKLWDSPSLRGDNHFVVSNSQRCTHLHYTMHVYS